MQKLAAWTLRSVKVIAPEGSESAHRGSHPTWASPTAGGRKTSAASLAIWDQPRGKAHL